MTAMARTSRYNGKKLNVVRLDSRNVKRWSGRVVVWTGTRKYPGTHGRRDRGSNVRQWATGDTIHLASCSPKGTYM